MVDETGCGVAGLIEAISDVSVSDRRKAISDRRSARVRCNESGARVGLGTRRGLHLSLKFLIHQNEMCITTQSGWLGKRGGAGLSKTKRLIERWQLGPQIHHGDVEKLTPGLAAVILGG